MSDNRIPLSWIQPTLADIPVGGAAYTVPWALEIELVTRRGFLNLKTSARPGLFGTSFMQVHHLSDGWTCTLHEPFLFTPTANPVGELVKELIL